MSVVARAGLATLAVALLLSDPLRIARASDHADGIVFIPTRPDANITQFFAEVVGDRLMLAAMLNSGLTSTTTARSISTTTPIR